MWERRPGYIAASSDGPAPGTKKAYGLTTLIVWGYVVFFLDIGHTCRPSPRTDNFCPALYIFYALLPRIICRPQGRVGLKKGA